MNINPSLIMGLALAYVERKNPELQEHDKSMLTVRVYDADGVGFHFVRCETANRWYYDEDSDDNHFNRADAADVQSAIEAGARVQIVGTRGASYGVWENWQSFIEAIQ